MRLANADVLPFDFTGSSEAVARYVGEIAELANKKREEAEEWNLGIEENLPWAVADPKKPFVAPKPRVVPPHFDFSPLQNASDALTDAAKAYSRAYDAAFASGAARPTAAQLAAVNRAVAEFERGLHLRHRAARPVLVPPLRLRARGLHRLRRQDAARGARGPRGEALGRREPERRGDREGDLLAPRNSSRPRRSCCAR